MLSHGLDGQWAVKTPLSYCWLCIHSVISPELTFGD